MQFKLKTVSIFGRQQQRLTLGETVDRKAAVRQQQVTRGVLVRYRKADKEKSVRPLYGATDVGCQLRVSCVSVIV